MAGFDVLSVDELSRQLWVGVDVSGRDDTAFEVKPPLEEADQAAILATIDDDSKIGKMLAGPSVNDGYYARLL